MVGSILQSGLATALDRGLFSSVRERPKQVKDLELDYDILPIERALGVEWCINSDSFQFKLDFKRQPLTRRRIISMVTSIYDPVDFVVPFILKTKLILQRFLMNWLFIGTIGIRIC